MWFASRGKLEFIREQLKQNHLVERKESIKKLIKSELETKSQEYMKAFDTYTTPI
jgi:hypothetical protein